jgi:integrase
MPPKTMPVEGVFERVEGSGIWYVRFRAGGKLVRKSFGRNRAAAVRYVEKARTLKRSGEGVVPSTAKKPVLTLVEMEQLGGDVTVNDLCDDYLHHIQKRHDLYKDQVNPPQRLEVIREAFGDRPAASVRPWEIDEWLDSLYKRSTRGDGRTMAQRPKPGTLNRLKAHLSAIYRHGKMRDKVAVNPARDVKQRRTNNGVIRYLTREEEQRLRAALQSHIETKSHLAQYQEPLVRHRLCELDVALGTGMRKGEQYGLKWKDIDFEEKIITLHRTKNGEGRRVYMIADVEAALSTLRELGLTRREGKTHPTPEDAVFAIGDNKKWWGQALKDAGIENLRWHDLRHTFCSRLAQSGASLKVIQEAAGHKTIAMTARYAHMDQSSLRNALAVLNRAPEKSVQPANRRPDSRKGKSTLQPRRRAAA